MPPNRCSNYPGRPRAPVRVRCIEGAGSARRSAVLDGTCSECRSRSAETREPTMAGTAQQPAQHSDLVHPKNRRGKHVHHGRTVAAWTGSVIGLVAFIVGAIAVVMKYWPMFWVAVGLAVVALIVTVVLQRMGYGAH